jgi:Family of unknown function (DUF6152)
MKSSFMGLVSALAALTATGASAHHSFAMYDRQKTVTVSGVVKEFTWAAPHVTIEVLSGKDKPVHWAIEGSSPTVLARGGWSPSLMKPGDTISLGLHPRKDGAAGGLLADEQQMLLNGEPPKGVLWLRAIGHGGVAR